MFALYVVVPQKLEMTSLAWSFRNSLYYRYIVAVFMYMYMCT
jgi:hypothetical protein